MQKQMNFFIDPTTYYLAYYTHRPPFAWDLDPATRHYPDQVSSAFKCSQDGWFSLQWEPVGGSHSGY
jgi:hypothetical protein